MDYILLSHDEFSILSDHLNLTYIYNTLSVDPTPARHVLHKLQRWTPKMSVFSYRMEHVMGELNYWTDLMTRWGVGCIAGSEHRAYGKMTSLLSQPCISPPYYETVEFPSKKEILLTQQSAVNEYDRCQQSNAKAWKEVPPQQVDAGGMRRMNTGFRVPSSRERYERHRADRFRVPSSRERQSLVMSSIPILPVRCCRPSAAINMCSHSSTASPVSSISTY
jgi:hypothetical protein